MLEPTLTVVDPAAVPQTVVFLDGKREVGRLEWSTGRLVFSGDMEASARIFGEFLKELVDQYIEDRLNAA